MRKKLKVFSFRMRNAAQRFHDPLYDGIVSLGNHGVRHKSLGQLTPPTRTRMRSAVPSNFQGMYMGERVLRSWLTFFEVAKKFVKKGKAVDIVYMVLSQAFDKVPHGRQPWKIRSYGILWELAKWKQN